MKTNTHPHFYFATAAAVALVITTIMTGCVTASYHKSQAAASSLQSAAADVQAEDRALDMTMASLNALVNKPPPVDLKLQYDVFSRNLDQLIDVTRRNDAAAQRVADTSTKYFANWDKEILDMNYDAVRNLSASRKAEVTGKVDTLNRYYRDTQNTIRPVIDYFVDIRKALSTDLTLSGLESVL